MSKRLPLRMVSALAAALFAFAGSDLPAQTQTPGSRPIATGVAVHGHWTIDVRNPDGTLASHTEFDNALHPAQGAMLLTGLLTNEFAAGRWSIILSGGTNGLCVTPSGTSSCLIAELGSVAPGVDVSSFIFQNLERTVPRDPPTGRPAGTFTLAGFAKITNSELGLRLAAVQTHNAICGSDRTPAACGAAVSGSTLAFTSHNLPTLVGVSFGQIVQVSVAISFS